MSQQLSKRDDDLPTGQQPDAPANSQTQISSSQAVFLLIIGVLGLVVLFWALSVHILPLGLIWAPLLLILIGAVSLFRKQHA